MTQIVYSRLLALVLAQFISLPLLAVDKISNRTDLVSSNLPIIVIDTYGQEIVDDPRIVAHMGIIDNGPGIRNYLTDSFNGYDSLIAIELRGSSSAYYPKKQYRFETQNAAGDNNNVSLLGMPSENDWILYGPYDDQSLIRNVLAYNLSTAMGHYTSRTRFCEIVLNGDYRGLYVLLEKVKRDNNRVDIGSMNETDITGDAVTGGYILKIDKFDGETIGYWSTANDVTYQYHYPKPADIVPEQETYIQNYIDQFENVMNGANPADSISGYPAYLDINSFVDHFLISELAKNVDAYRISSYLYKKRDSNGGKLYAGPIWDFNLSFGKAWYPSDLFVFQGWQVNYYDLHPWDGFQVPFWWEVLAADDNFKTMVEIRWQELRSGLFSLDSMYSRIDNLVDHIAEARVRNFDRWPDAVSDHSYSDEILQMKGWLSQRVNWIDNNIDQLAIASEMTGNTLPTAITLEQNYPNPFNGATTIRYRLNNSSYVSVTIFDLRGNKIITLIESEQTAGSYYVTWDGTSAQGNILGTGVYIYQISSSGLTENRKMILLK